MPSYLVVCGPPCAGKTTFVARHRAPADLVLDWDDVAASLGVRRRQNVTDRRTFEPIAAEWDRLLAESRNHPGRVWVVRARPACELVDLVRELGAEVVEIRAPFRVLVARAKRRPNAAAQIRIVYSWHRKRGLPCAL